MDTQHLKKTKSLGVNLGSILRIILWITLIKNKQFMTTCNLVRSKICWHIWIHPWTRFWWWSLFLRRVIVCINYGHLLVMSNMTSILMSCFSLACHAGMEQTVLGKRHGPNEATQMCVGQSNGYLLTWAIMCGFWCFHMMHMLTTRGTSLRLPKTWCKAL